jgi:energy-coupling factor transport system ATP-binding protein
MDRARKRELALMADRMCDQGAAVLVATHDVEFAAEFADRVLIMGRGEIVADGPAGRLLSGGWYYSTEVARALSGRAYGLEDGIAAIDAALRERDGGRAGSQPGAPA